MKVVVTGPSGHVGTALVTELVKRGHQVRAVCFDEAHSLDGLDIERVEGDVLDRDSLRAAFEGQEWLFHLAGIVDLRRGQGELMRAVNVDGARNAAEMALECGVKRMVHFSSVHAFATYRLGIPLDESGDRCTSRRDGLYNWTKSMGEAEVRKVIARGLDCVIVNPTGILGPYDHLPSHMGAFLMQMYRRKIPMLVKGAYDWADVRDVIEGAIAAAERGRTGENYLLGGHNASIRDLAEITEEVTGIRQPRRAVPLWLVQASLPLTQAALAITRGRQLVTRFSLATLGSRIQVDCSKAHDELGYTPRPLSDTLRSTYRWYADAGMLEPTEALLTTA
jgi:dihydroflavonol-4-reductase